MSFRVLQGSAEWTPERFFDNGESGIFLDCSDASTMFSDAAGTSPASVDGLVARINDKSGNGIDFSQSTSGYRPTLRSGGYLDFDGTADFFSSVSTHQPSAISSAGAMYAGGLFGLHGYSGSGDMLFSAWWTTSSNRIDVYVPYSVGPGSSYFIHGINNLSTPLSNTLPSDGATYEWEAHVDGYNNMQYLDGVENMSNTADTVDHATPLSTGAAARTVYLGKRGDGTAYYPAYDLYSAVLLDRVPTDTERAQFRAWMRRQESHGLR